MKIDYEEAQLCNYHGKPKKHDYWVKLTSEITCLRYLLTS